MNHLHSEGILHGDLKAGNVLLKAELRPVESGTLDDAGCEGQASGAGPACATSVGGSGAVAVTATAGGTSGLGARDIGGARVVWREVSQS